MTKNVNVINNGGKDVKVTVNEINGKMQIVIDVVGAMVELSTLNPGDIFKDNDGIEYIVCEHFSDGTTAVVTKELLENSMDFGNTNDWKESGIRTYFNGDYLKELERKFGAENIITHESDLLSMDGYDDYGTCMDKVSLMSFDQNRKYRKLIGKLSEWEWLLTPDQTPTSNNDSSYVQCVDSNGGVSYDVCGYGGGVRPFFILKSSISVSSNVE